jgi:hypothetical protein
MTWVIGNIPTYTAIEMFSQHLRTEAPITGITAPDSESSNTFDEPVPTSVEEWIVEQQRDLDFLRSLDDLPHVACRDGLYLYAPDNASPRILVPPRTREALIRFTHHRMFHLGHTKVAERLLRSYFWMNLRGDTRRILTNCPDTRRIQLGRTTSENQTQITLKCTTFPPCGCIMQFVRNLKPVPNPYTYYSSCSHLRYKLSTHCVKERREVNIEINSVHSQWLSLIGFGL